MNLVYYCPGSAPGSPAGLSRADAEKYLAQDSRYIDIMAAADSIERPVAYPHIGGTCAKCRGRVKVATGQQEK